MKKTNILSDATKCSGCWCCQLMCSLTYTGAFNPEMARVSIEPGKAIEFGSECLANCHLCANYCPSGAMTVKKGK